jgi:hypothetical protein
VLIVISGSEIAPVSAESTALLMAGTESHPGQPDRLRLAIHLVPTKGEPCSEIDWTAFSCDDIDLVGDSSVPQRAYFLFTGTDSLVVAEFGCYYRGEWSPDVIGDWHFCTEPSFQRLSPGWPRGLQDNEAFLRWWDAPIVAAADSIVVLGAIDLLPGVKGGLSAFATQEGSAVAITVRSEYQEIYWAEFEKFGQVSLDGSPDNPTNNPCVDANVPTKVATWTQIKSVYR